MLEFLATAVALSMCWLGFGLLSLSQREHWTAAAAELAYPSRRRVRDVRSLGALLLAAALAPCMAGHGAGFGLLLWMLLLAATAASMTFTLAWRPRWLALLAILMCDFG